MHLFVLGVVFAKRGFRCAMS